MDNIGIIDIVKVLDESNLGKIGAKELEAIYNQQQRDLAPLLTAAKANPKRQDPDLNKKLQKAQEELEKRRAELRDELLLKAQPVIDKLAKERGFMMVIARPQAVMYVSEKCDLTQAAIAQLDSEFPLK